MLFYLTDSLKVSPSDPEFEGIYYSIDNILRAFEDRRHMVMGDFEILQWFSSFFADPTPRKRVILNMMNNFSTTTIPAEVTEYIKVIKGAESMEVEGGITIHNVNYSKFKNSQTIEATRIIGEDENDAKLYEQINRWYIASNKISFNVAVRFEHGGGNSTHRKMEAHKTNHNIFVCLVDTDQRFPNGDYGKTCKNCLSIPLTLPFERLCLIDAHEVENLVPRSLLDQLPWKHGNNHIKKYYDSIWTNLQNDTNGWRYIDLKSGINKHKDYVNIPEWMSYVKKVYDANSFKTKEFDVKFSNAQIGGEILSGLSKSILKDTVSLLEGKTDEEIIKINGFLPYQSEEWKRIGQIILDVGISSSREAIN